MFKSKISKLTFELQKVIVLLLPECVAKWLWNLDVNLGSWAPHVFARTLGGNVTYWRIDDE